MACKRGKRDQFTKKIVEAFGVAREAIWREGDKYGDCEELRKADALVLQAWKLVRPLDESAYFSDGHTIIEVGYGPPSKIGISIEVKVPKGRKKPRRNRPRSKLWGPEQKGSEDAKGRQG